MVSVALILMNAPLTLTLAAKIEHVATHLGRTNVFARKKLATVFQSMAAFRSVIQMPFALKSMVLLSASVYLDSLVMNNSAQVVHTSCLYACI